MDYGKNIYCVGYFHWKTKSIRKLNKIKQRSDVFSKINIGWIGQIRCIQISVTYFDAKPHRETERMCVGIVNMPTYQRNRRHTILIININYLC